MSSRAQAVADLTPRGQVLLLLTGQSPAGARLLGRHPAAAALLGAVAPADASLRQMLRAELRATAQACFPALLTCSPDLWWDVRYWWRRRHLAAYQQLAGTAGLPRCWVAVAGLPPLAHGLLRRALGTAVVARALPQESSGSAAAWLRPLGEIGARAVVDHALKWRAAQVPAGLPARWHAAYDEVCSQARRRTLDLLGLALLSELSADVPSALRMPLLRLVPWLCEGSSGLALAASSADRDFAGGLVTRVLDDIGFKATVSEGTT